MPINVNTTPQQIGVTVGETQIDVSVGGGVGPTGNSGTVAVSAPITNAGTSTAAVIGLSVGTGLAVASGALAVTYGTTSTSACRGDDARLSDTREWSAATVSQADAEAGTSTSRFAFTPQRVFQAIAAWWAGSAANAKLDGIATGATANATDAQLRDRSTHTGTQLAATISDFASAVVAAAPPTTNASLLTSGTLPDARLSSNIARTSDVSSAVAAVVNAAPATLDTLNELAAALGNDANFATTVTNSLAGKAAAIHTHSTAHVTGLTASLDAKYPQLNSAAYAIPTLVPLAVGTTGRPSYYGTYDQEGNVEEYLQSYGGPNRDNPSWQPIIGGSFYSENFGSTYPITYRWMFMPANYKSAAWGFRVATLTDPRNYGGFVTVGDVGNANNSDGFGGVAYEYRIGKFCVTVSEWVAFLNAVAKTDTNSIFYDGTGYGSTGFPSQITRTGSPGSYVYAAVAGHSQRPAAFMRWTDAARYCNWLHNGKPTGAQGNATTEDGAYTITSSTIVLLSNAGAQYRLPTESEWIKAGRYKGGSTNAGYWKFSTQSDDNPDRCVTDLLGSGLATVAGSGSAADLTGTLNAARLPSTAVTAGSYGSASSVATFSVGADGRLTAAGSTSIAIAAGAVSGLAAIATSGSASDLSAGTVPFARLPVGTSSTSVAAGNDARLSDTRTPTDGSVTDAKITSGGLSTSSLNWAAIAPWAANTAYNKGDLVSFQGIAYRRSAAGTSGATFNVAMWQQITPSEFVASQITSGTLSDSRLSQSVQNTENIYLWASFR